MTRVMLTGVTLVLTSATLSAAQPKTINDSNYSKAEVKQMIRTAHTSDQYLALASYFRAQQEVFEQQAQSERTEWVRRSQNVTGLAEKYPRPVDSSRNRYEYFEYEAGKLSAQAAHYENLVMNPTPSSVH